MPRIQLSPLLIATFAVLASMGAGLPAHAQVVWQFESSVATGWVRFDATHPEFAPGGSCGFFSGCLEDYVFTTPTGNVWESVPDPEMFVAFVKLGASTEPDDLLLTLFLGPDGLPPMGSGEFLTIIGRQNGDLGVVTPFASARDARFSVVPEPSDVSWLWALGLLTWNRRRWIRLCLPAARVA